MLTMAYTKLCFVVAFSFVALTLQQDPVLAFCRRWSHQTALVDGRLYIDGGQVAYTNLATNYTNDYLVFGDLSSRTDVGFPAQHNNLSKPASVPSLSGGYLWADEVNKCFYQFGGEFPVGQSPRDFGLLTYDVILNQWNITDYQTTDTNWQRPAYGAGTYAESRGLGFYYGGWLSNRTTPGWQGPPVASNSIVQFNFTTGNLWKRNHTDGIGRAEGQMVFLPVSDNGLLVYFGGVEDTYRNGSYYAANMTKIQIYDINSGKWYTQTATGDVPLARRQFCAGVTWPDDRSSFNIYLYGGYGFGSPAAFDDVYILSLPSFKWIKGYPLGGPETNQFGHGGCSATVVNPDQMIVIGGWFPNPSFTDCDQPDAQGQHNMILGNNTGKQDNGIWDKYDPKLSSYAVPTMIVSAVGGGTTGGATVREPASWDYNDVKVYYGLTPTFPSRAATRYLRATASPSPSSLASKKNIGAIAGGTVGGLLVLIAILCTILFCLHRRKKAKKESVHNPPSAPPAELAVTQFPHEMGTSGISKYMSAHGRSNPNELPAHSEYALEQSHTTSYGYASPNASDPAQMYGSTSPYTDDFHGSPQSSGYGHSPLRSPNNPELYFPSDHTAHDTQQDLWDQQSSLAHQTQGGRRQHSYPTPTSPYDTTNASVQQQPQVYYPPPQDSSQGTQHSPIIHRGSPADRQYSGDAQYGDTSLISTTNTPANLYAQSAPDGDGGFSDGGFSDGYGRHGHDTNNHL